MPSAVPGRCTRAVTLCPWGPTQPELPVPPSTAQGDLACVPDGTSLCLTWPFPFIPPKTCCDGLEMLFGNTCLEDACLAAAPSPGDTPSRTPHPGDTTSLFPAPLPFGCQGHGSIHILKVSKLVIPDARFPCRLLQRMLRGREDVALHQG